VKDFAHHGTVFAGADCVLSAAGQNGIYICSYHFAGCKLKCQNLYLRRNLFAVVQNSR